MLTHRLHSSSVWGITLWDPMLQTTKNHRAPLPFCFNGPSASIDGSASGRGLFQLVLRRGTLFFSESASQCSKHACCKVWDLSKPGIFVRAYLVGLVLVF